MRLASHGRVSKTNLGTETSATPCSPSCPADPSTHCPAHSDSETQLLGVPTPNPAPGEWDHPTHPRLIGPFCFRCNVVPLPVSPNLSAASYWTDHTLSWPALCASKFEHTHAQVTHVLRFQERLQDSWRPCCAFSQNLVVEGNSLTRPGPVCFLRASPSKVRGWHPLA